MYFRGNGENPSLDQLWTGTHGGYSVFANNMDDLIAHLRKHGYNGIEYDGGTRLGGNLRGGGGIRHQSFVFWDDAFVNSCRVDNEDVRYPESDLPLQKIRAATMIKNWKEPE